MTQPIYLQFAAGASGPSALSSETDGLDALTGMDIMGIASQAGDFLMSPDEPLFSTAGFAGETTRVIARGSGAV